MLTLIRLHPKVKITLSKLPVFAGAFAPALVGIKVNKVYLVWTRLTPDNKPAVAVVKLDLKVRA
jgi:hypothetical protein